MPFNEFSAQANLCHRLDVACLAFLHCSLELLRESSRFNSCVAGPISFRLEAVLLFMTRFLYTHSPDSSSRLLNTVTHVLQHCMQQA